MCVPPLPTPLQCSDGDMTVQGLMLHVICWADEGPQSASMLQ